MRPEFDSFFFANRKNQTHIFVFSLFLGFIGVDRFALGQPVLGILKLLTLGGFLVWALIDLFLVGGSARRKNLNIAREYISQQSGELMA